MHINSLLSLGLLALTARAQRMTWNDGSQYANKCGQTTWEPITDGPSQALASDCAEIVNKLNAAPAGGAFFSGVKDFKAILNEGTCTFAVRGKDNGGFYMGRDDMMDLIRDGMARWTRNGKVAGGGRLRCGEMDAQWRIHVNV
ncbi:hypothetical protein PFICI_14375 [Pestalotiopsis fici W106-1]|uniref:Ecp2 effector protein-like domain-containing protein n=1 Tax=Pestalotiopsis fici (strain W106-1 / CGMCC3.15140) TaxID=1229662 RepID=W3WL75_PESFW|nr:uncharacterized protein PFICI_14375 [Pestalotiopsis fici W106-1]ETS74509.1 hypothetical protein PFICI_14375 [Pestalotiopsis fici W106-1]